MLFPNEKPRAHFISRTLLVKGQPRFFSLYCVNYCSYKEWKADYHMYLQNMKIKQTNPTTEWKQTDTRTGVLTSYQENNL